MFSSDPSFMYWNESGNISLNINFPGVVTKYFPLYVSGNTLCLNDETGIAIRV